MKRSRTPAKPRRVFGALAINGPSVARTRPTAPGQTWYRITNKGPDTCEVMIYDEIGYYGIKAESFVSELGKVTAKTITLRINSPGGQVFDGFAIYNALKAHPAQVNVKIEGVAASIASIIALAGDSVQIAETGYFMIHDPSSYAFGTAADLRKEAELLDKLRDSIADVYAKASGKPIEAIKAQMSAETWFNADEAVAFGLADSVVGKADDDEDDDEDPENRMDLTRAVAAMAASGVKLPRKLGRIAAKAQASSSTTPAAAPAAPTSPTHPHQTETPMALKITVRDGKQFVNINGTEHEVENGSPVAPAASGQPQNAAPADQIAAAEKKAVEKERAYRTEFTTAVATANMDAKTAEDFEKKFYGRPIEDVKFLASSHIGARTAAVGEGTPAAKPEDKKDEKPEDVIRAYAAKRFDFEPQVRNIFGARYAVPGSDQYKASQARYIDRELAMYRDAKPKQQAEMLAAAK